MKFRHLILFLVFIGGLISCKHDKKIEEAPPKVVKEYKIPPFSGDSAYLFVEKQVNFGPRVTGNIAHKNTQKWYEKKFKSYGLNVEYQSFEASFPNGKTEKAANIIAHYNPGKDKKIIIASHYDSRYMAEKDSDPKKVNLPIDGADDGASGVGVILELARILKDNPVDISVDFILFDAEDNGNETDDETWCLGSQHWSKEAKKSGYKADLGFLLDMVGAKGAVFPKEYISKTYAGDVQNQLWDLANGMGYGDLFYNIDLGSINDDHLYVNRDAGIKMVDIINLPNPAGGFGAYHHTHDDNMKIIDKETLRKTGQVLAAFIYKYANDDL